MRWFASCSCTSYTAIGSSTPRGLWEPSLASVVTIFGWYVVGITAGILSQMRTAVHARAYREQIEAASHREQLRTTLLCMADGVLLIDCDGRLSLDESRRRDADRLEHQ